MNTFEEVKALFREKSGKKLLAFSVVVFLIIAVIVFLAVFRICAIVNLKQMDEYLADYDFPEAYLLDQMVNEILFNAGDDLSRAAAEAVREKGLGLTRRYIPGDDPLPLEVQAQMLDCLKETEEASVLSVSERGALRPEKAALYLFGADATYV